MASVYILFSKKLKRFYTGSCTDLPYRLGQHINKHYPESFTVKADDWELFISIDDLFYEQARQIESHIKQMKSKTFILNLRKYPEIIEKLKRKYQ